MNKSTHVAGLLAPNVVEVENKRVGFAAFDAWMKEEVLHQLSRVCFDSSSGSRQYFPDHADLIARVVLAAVPGTAATTLRLQTVRATFVLVELGERLLDPADETLLHQGKIATAVTVWGIPVEFIGGGEAS